MRKLALGVAALCLFACGEVVPLDPDAAVDAQEIDAVPDPCDAASLDPATFGTCFARLACGIYADCTGSDLSFVDCENLGFEIIGGLSPTQLEVLVASAMTSNRVTWNGTVAKTCLDGLAAGGCAIFKNDSDPIAACAITTGHVANGALCQNDIECQQAGAQCVQTVGTPGNQCTDYTCRPPAATNASCANGGFCGIGDHCVRRVVSMNDTSFCGAGSAGAMCDRDGDCDLGLYCNGGLGNSTVMGTCTTSKSAGAACKTDTECAGELACVGNFNAVMGVCRDIRQPNAVCDNNSFINACYGHQVCENPGANTTGMCHPAPNLGQPCAQRDGTAQACGLFMACENGLCREPGAIGDTCTMTTGDISTDPNGCNAGLFCDKDLSSPPAAMGACRAPQANGSRCQQDDQCSSDHCGAAPNNTCSTYPVCSF